MSPTAPHDGCDLLAIGAHPDDVEVHVGGILALASDRGLKTSPMAASPRRRPTGCGS